MDDEERKRITALVRQLRQPGSVSRLVESLLEADSGGRADVGLLVAVVEYSYVRSWRERVLAAWTLGRVPLSPRQVPRVTSALSGILSTGKQSADAATHGCYRAWHIGLVPGFLSSLIIGFFAFIPDGDIALRLLNSSIVIAAMTLFNSALFGLICLPVALPAVLASDRHRMNWLRAECAAALGRHPTVDAIPPLAEAVQDISPRVRQAAKRALQQTLPLLTAEYYGRVEPSTLSALCKMLSETDEELVVTVLEALEKVGTGTVVSEVLRLTSGGATPRIRQTAQRVLPVLLQRRRQENDARMLLRPSPSPAISAGTLLRPISCAATADPQVLLRPAEREK